MNQDKYLIFFIIFVLIPITWHFIYRNILLYYSINNLIKLRNEIISKLLNDRKYCDIDLIFFINYIILNLKKYTIFYILFEIFILKNTYNDTNNKLNFTTEEYLTKISKIIFNYSIFSSVFVIFFILLKIILKLKYLLEITKCNKIFNQINKYIKIIMSYIIIIIDRDKNISENAKII